MVSGHHDIRKYNTGFNTVFENQRQEIEQTYENNVMTENGLEFQETEYNLTTLT